MKYIADLHIHSYYSRATSKQLNLEHLFLWGQLKGLNVIATGDITHPLWLEEMRSKLQESEQGLFQLRPEFRVKQNEVPKACAADVHFILSGEISTIYKKHDKVRKVHSVVFMPSFAAVETFQATLDRIGNIHSDGRPILGLDTRDLLEIVLETDDNAQFIPAHIWTPWFSIFGSKSGFDSLEECFEDLTPHIFALETGLSSDPPMNWRLSMLDDYTLVSNSDAHSPAKLAREANVFDTDLTYNSMFQALKNRNDGGFKGTIEFFPEEGKYHMDGHRKCNHRMKPSETIANNGLCPVCGKPAVKGVNYRVEELADRPEGYQPKSRQPFKSLIPLPEVLSEITGVGPNSKKVNQLYHKALHELGSELNILMNIPLTDIQHTSGSLLAEAVRRMRQGQVDPDPGYDGEYGVIRIFKEREREKLLQQETLFSMPEKKQKNDQFFGSPKSAQTQITAVKEDRTKYGLNSEQQKAVNFRGAPLIIQAGPGTGKTRTLTHRLASMLESNDAKPKEILAITFTNKAAEEMRSRLALILDSETVRYMTIQTFHAFGVSILREQDEFYGRDSDFIILDPQHDENLAEKLKAQTGQSLSKAVLERISQLKNQGYSPDAIPKEILEAMPSHTQQIFEAYEQLLEQENAVDFDDLINLPYRLLSQNPDLRRQYQNKYRVIAVDEFQDISKTQYELFRILAFTAKDVCVIGDPDQAIYGFRGASANFFKRFTNDFNANCIRLTQNYRSAQNILNASLQIMGHENHGDEKILWSNIDPDIRIVMEVSPSEKAEAEFVVHKIEQLMGGTTFFSMDSQRVDERESQQTFSFSDFAILLRSKSLAENIVEALARSGIPFQKIEENRLTQHPFVALFRAALRYVQTHQIEPLEVAAKAYFGENSSAYVQFHKETLALPNDVEVDTVLDWLQSTHAFQDNNEIAELTKQLKNIVLQNGAENDRVLDALALHRQIDLFDDRADRVNVLTLHASKGLEFPVVFIPGCEEGLLPLYFPGQKLDLEEERRLLYVGMTRAQRYLYLCRAKKRTIYGQKHDREPSRFLTSVSEALVERQLRKTVKKPKNDQLALF